MSGDLLNDPDNYFGATQRYAEGSRQLIFAIIHQAVWDASQHHWGRALDAIKFFYEGNVRVYVELLGLDHERFMLELADAMDNPDNPRLSPEQRDFFKRNYQRWLAGFGD